MDSESSSPSTRPPWSQPGTRIQSHAVPDQTVTVRKCTSPCRLPQQTFSLDPLSYTTHRSYFFLMTLPTLSALEALLKMLGSPR